MRISQYGFGLVSLLFPPDASRYRTSS